MSTIAVALLIMLFVALTNPGFLDNVRSRVTGAAGQTAGSPTGKILVGALGAFAPDMAVLSGFVSDIVNVQFRHSVLSFSAILAVVLNRFIFGKGAVQAAIAAAVPAAAAATGTAPVATALGTVNAPPAPAPAPSPAASEPQAPSSAASTARTVVETVTGRPVLGYAGTVRPTQVTGNPADVSTYVSDLGGGPAIRGGGKPQRGGELPDFFKQYYNPCAIRGLAFLDTENSPMGMVALMTIFTTVFWDMWINNKRTTPEILGNAGFGLVVLLMNFGAYAIFNCYGKTTTERLMNTFKAFVWGAIAGSVAFLIFQYAPNGSQYLPIDPSSASLSQPSSSKTSAGEQSCPPGQVSINGQCTPAPAGGAKCNAPNDGDQFVCDAYKNGKLISTTFSS